MKIIIKKNTIEIQPEAYISLDRNSLFIYYPENDTFVEFNLKKERIISLRNSSEMDIIEVVPYHGNVIFKFN